MMIPLFATKVGTIQHKSTDSWQVVTISGLRRVNIIRSRGHPRTVCSFVHSAVPNLQQIVQLSFCFSLVLYSTLSAFYFYTSSHTYIDKKKKKNSYATI